MNAPLRYCVIALVPLTLTGCKATKVVEQVPVHVHDTTYIAHTEYIFQRDTVWQEHETIIREANPGDSALLAQLGLQLKDNEKAILILQRELVRQIKELSTVQQDSSFASKENPVPIKETETVEVKKPLAWWQKGLMWAGAVGIFIALAAVAVRLRR